MKKKMVATLALAALFSGASSAAVLRVAADPVPHSEILNYVKKIDPDLDLQVIELNGNLNANELLATWRRRCISSRWGSTRAR